MTSWHDIWLGVAVGVATTCCVSVWMCLRNVRLVEHPYRTPETRSDRKVMLAGSFNPPHIGHLNMIKYLSRCHRVVYIVVAYNPGKRYSVSAEDRETLLKGMLRENMDNVVVVSVSHVRARRLCPVTSTPQMRYDGLIWKLAVKLGVTQLYRGIRTWKQDGFSEQFLRLLNILGPVLLGFRRPIPTVFLQSAPEYVHISSTLVRQRIGRSESVSDIIPGTSAKIVAEMFETEAIR